MNVTQATVYIEQTTGCRLTPRSVQRLIQRGLRGPFGTRLVLPAERRPDGSYRLTADGIDAFVGRFATKEQRP